MSKTGCLALVLLAFSAPAFAVDGGAVIGGAAGAAAGAVIGKKVSGDNGAVLGAAIGAATGVAIGSKDQPTQAAPVKVRQASSDDESRHEHHDNGRHLGERKNKHKNKNKHKHDD